MDKNSDTTNNSHDYKLRISHKAKHMRIQISIERGLEVIAPTGTSPRQIEKFLEEKKSWIEKNLIEMNRKKKIYGEEYVSELPEYISFRGVEEIWWVSYQETKSKRISIKIEEPNQLYLKGNTKDIKLCRNGLRRFLTSKGKKYLIPWIEGVSSTTNLKYGKINIRGQKTRWGSCSYKKIINLNFKLLFLPSYLVRYVMVHELCHTTHMNHSKRFWKMVDQHEPNYTVYEKELKDANRYIPLWVDQKE